MVGPARSNTRLRPLSSSELAAFCLQVSIILKSGIPLHDGVSMLYDDVGETRIKSVLKTVSSELADNRPVHEALDKAAVFPPYLVNMARIGAESGKLDDVMASLSDYYDREDALSQSIRSAVVYPMALIVMMLAVMMILAAKVLPVFDQVFRGLGVSMSPAAAGIMNFGLAAGRFSFVLLIFAALILGTAFFLFKTEAGGRLWAGIASKGKFSEELSTARFASSMALMLASGLDTERALRMAGGVVTSSTVRQKIEECLTLIGQNSSFIDALSSVGIFPKMTTRMLGLGFRAGSMDTVMKKIAVDCQDAIDNSLARRVSLIEPVSVAVLSVLIGIILISVMMPLMSVMSTIG